MKTTIKYIVLFLKDKKFKFFTRGGTKGNLKTYSTNLAHAWVFNTKKEALDNAEDCARANPDVEFFAFPVNFSDGFLFTKKGFLGAAPGALKWHLACQDPRRYFA